MSYSSWSSRSSSPSGGYGGSRSGSFSQSTPEIRSRTSSYAESEEEPYTYYQSNLSYSFSGTNLDVDQLQRQLKNYGIEATIHHGKNTNQISVNLNNPNQQQLQGVKQVLFPVEEQFFSSLPKLGYGQKFLPYE